MQPADALSQIVGAFRLDRATYTRFELSAPWGHRVTHRGQVKFVLVARGSAWVRTAALPAPLQLHAGDLFLVLDGAPYSVSDRPTSRCVDCTTLEPLRESMLIRYGGDGAGATLVSVALQLVPGEASVLLEALPPLIVLQEDQRRGRALESLAELLRSETSYDDLGALPIVRRLSEALYISAIRTYLQDEQQPKRGVLAAIAHPQLRQALHALHGDVAQPWTVATLAKRAGMSRASFAAKFREAVGVAPLEYLTARRVEQARPLLRDGRPLAEVASEVGYDSPVSFSRAFRRVAGVSPGSLRRVPRVAAPQPSERPSRARRTWTA